ncbi:two-component response regulator ARR10-like [Salvia miltiorrhiza]|uniref:two-component response regulator ARR10-like n=1 Tax=Salvia miltiorrhiza TaxID=226208 RepID=UPI0025AB7951|nr:two-component response regulator ARR10-like [Salvia miltiorrhiza]
MHEIHVLLVDHDAEALNIAKQLEMWQYKVSCAELASPAIPMLANAKFDVVMANINSPDPHGFKLLLQHALNMWMADDNAFVAMRALENGAFLCIKKPPPMEFLRSLWQHVMREKGKFKTRSRGRYDDYDGEYDSDNNIMSQNGNVRRKMCTEWTQELHAKFMNAVEQLGEGSTGGLIEFIYRVFPKRDLRVDERARLNQNASRKPSPSLFLFYL